MPRGPRQRSKSGIYHIMVRGVNRSEIFFDDQDRGRYLDILTRYKEKFKFQIYAYCLMPNHLHLLGRDPDNCIDNFMKAINISFVYHMNRKYDRVGHLFQDRYRSEEIDSERYLLGCARYIHKNSAAAGLVQSPNDYIWSSYPNYLGTADKRSLVDTDFLLGFYSENRVEAVKRLQQFTLETDEYEYMDCNEDVSISSKRTFTSLDIDKTISQILQKHGMSIHDLKNTSHLSVRNSILQIGRAHV